MDFDKYLEGQSMQRPPLFESDSFIYWKNRFETYVKSKDLDLWHVITNGDFQPIVQNPETKLDEVIPFEKQTDDLKKKLAKNNEAKMVIYNALPRKEYERIFMCNTAKEIWKTLLITHQGNSQVKDNKIDLLVQQYEQFVISEDESIDSAFARFNTIITSLKALDEGYSSKNYVKCKYVTRNTGKGRKNEENTDSYETLRRNPYDSVTFIIDDPNFTMKEYIRLEEEKAQRHGRTFNCQTATYSKMEYCEDEDDSFTNFETEYPTIVFDDTSDAALSCEPTVSPLNENEIDFRISFDEFDDEDYMVIFDKNSFSYKIISVDNLKTGLENKNDKINMPSFPSPEPTTSHYDDLNFFKDFEYEFPAITYNDDLTKPSECFQHIEESDLNMSLLPSRDQRDLWLRYQVEGYSEDIVHSYEQRLEMICGRSVNRVHVLDFSGLTKRMRQTLGDRLRIEFILEFLGTCGVSDTEIGLDVVDTLCFQLGGVRRRMTWRQFLLALGLHTDEEMAKAGFGAYWLGSERTPEKVTGVDLFYLRSMNRGTANVLYLLAQYLFMHAEGRKSEARLSGVTSLGVLQLILDCLGPERQSDAAVGAPGAAEDAPIVDEGAQADLAPVQAPQPLPPAPMTMQQRISRLEGEVQELRWSVVGLRGDVAQSITNQGRMQYGVSLGLGYGVLTSCTDLAVKKSTIWYTLKKTCVELVRAF
ncbi:hypothetical protein Tco_0270298 [Tanacetum coccineum]